VMSKPPGNT